jgi:hypothetical protein
VLRIGVFAALILMLAGARLPFKAAAHRMTVVVAMDQSQSIAPDQRRWMLQRIAAIRRAMDPRDRLAVIGFGRDAQLLAPLSDPRLLTLSAAGADTGATDIAGALITAAGVFPPIDEKRLVLLSDGVETTNRATDELPALSEAGVRVFTTAPPPSAVARIALTGFDAPSTVHAQTSFALHLDIASEASYPVDAHIRLYGEGGALGGRQVQLRPGINRFELPYEIDRPGPYILKAAIEVAPDLALVNGSAVAAVSVAPPPHVLLIANSPPESLVKALELRNFDVANAGPHGLSPRAADYLGYQAVIIANVTADALAPEVQSALNRYVADYGGGLIVTGDTLRDSKFHGGARKNSTHRVPAATPATLARTHRGLSANRSIQLDELQLALPGSARRRTHPLRQGSRHRAAQPARRYRLRRRHRLRLRALCAGPSAAARRGPRRVAQPRLTPRARRRH